MGKKDKTSTYRKMFGSSEKETLQSFLEPSKEAAEKVIVGAKKTYRKMFGGGD